MSRHFLKWLLSIARAADRLTGRRLRGWIPAPLLKRVLPYRTALIPVREDSIISSAAATGYVPPIGLLPRFDPLSFDISSALSDRPHLNVLLPSLAMTSMSGGPNTALNIAGRLAAMGVPIRLLSTDLPPDANTKPLLNHIQNLTGENQKLPKLEIVDASRRDRRLTLGANDIFMATAWWTAQMAKYAVHQTNHCKFVYLIQDYEPLLHPASSTQALAEETYSLDHIPVINTSLLHEFLSTRRIGRYSRDEFAEAALVFEPAIDTSLFFPQAQVAPNGKRRLLFYARPTGGWRNLFELGVAALQKLIGEGSIQPHEWEFLGMGEKFAPIDLGKGCVLKPLPWLDLENYAQQMRQADVLLSLMLSPHPSYPPLEMAACGKPVVTTTYANKTAERLAEISPNIIGVPATIESIADGILRAIRRASFSPSSMHKRLILPQTWTESLSNVVPRLHQSLLELFGVPRFASLPGPIQQSPSRFFPGYRSWPEGYYELLRISALKQRRDQYPKCDSSLFSFVTTVWNTAPQFVAELAESVFGQDGGTEFEWIILDNGTSRADTRALLKEIANHPAVRLVRVDENIGIVKGLRYCLERAGNRYIVPLDSDDLLTPDCLRILASCLAAANYPALAYTDEDKVSGDRFRDPYCKPDWDPVLFAHSCYIAHLCAIDRKLALELAAYTNLEAEGSHDWDTFVRFWQAGYRPHHIAEVVYSWRMHPQSTSSNIKSKSYIHLSQRSVLDRFISRVQKTRDYKVELSPLFSGAPDWRFVPASDVVTSIPTILFGTRTASATEVDADSDVIKTASRLEDLLAAAKTCAERSQYVHLQSASVTIDEPTWAAEAQTLMDLFRDTAIVGGRIHDGSNIIRADCYFGFGEGCDSPNVGRFVKDPGYFAQMWKPHSASAVPIEHCVARADFLIDALLTLVGTGVSLSYLGAWLGAIAKARGQRVVYSPFLSARIKRRMEEASALETSAFCIALTGSMPDAELMSPRLGLTPQTAYLPMARDERAKQEQRIALRRTVDDQTAEAIASRVIAKSKRLLRERLPSRSPQPAGISFSLITTVWDTDPSYIAALADSILGQDRDVLFEWLILDNGSVRPDTIEYLARLEEQNSVRLFRVEQNIGIVGGLRYCLERAQNDYVIPIDSDDLLTPDAFRRLSDALNDPGQPAYIFSNEDILNGSRLASPIKRWDFDPILNACDSYIWHLCAFRRFRALQLQAYTDAGAEYCHDWDTITRFADAGEVIEHVPHVLYHWRTHAQSSSNSGSLNSGSMQSTKWLLERTIARQKDPSLYEVRLFPISRGVDQYAIMRKPIKPLRLCLLYLGDITTDIPAALAAKLSAATGEKFSADFRSLSCPEAQSDAVRTLLASDCDAVVVVTHGHEPRDEIGIWEAMLLLELHADVAAAAGRTTDGRGKVLSACASAAAALTETPSWVGMARTDPGPYALALKRQTATTIPPDFFVCRTSVLREALASTGGQPAPLVERIAVIARRSAMRLAYSPLIEAIKT